MKKPTYDSLKEQKEVIGRIIQHNIRKNKDIPEEIDLNEMVDFEDSIKKRKKHSEKYAKKNKHQIKYSKSKERELKQSQQANDVSRKILDTKRRDEIPTKLVSLKNFQNDGTFKNESDKWGIPEEIPKDATEKEMPNFGLSGALLKDTNMVNGIIVKYNEPSDAMKPIDRWRIYPFKEKDALQVLYIHRQSTYLIGKEKRVTDIILRHPSISKQHAAIQYRQINDDEEDYYNNDIHVIPYIIDLNSTNGTFVNDEKIEPQRYVELKSGDVLKFGFSSREYVIMKETIQDEDVEDDEKSLVDKDEDKSDSCDSD
ncbi:Pre-mRNA leakage protein 1 [Intoshia linei]|uniref:Pre-mRNA leakage protein 1 n=1 Tax=Intoshia linei TaxID=1819745 RepID=A0A177AZJ9_9BILA|nr:Pre-mRNA leakage protein 1 [Intoshia linei]